MQDVWKVAGSVCKDLWIVAVLLLASKMTPYRAEGRQIDLRIQGTRTARLAETQDQTDRVGGPDSLELEGMTGFEMANLVCIDLLIRESHR